MVKQPLTGRMSVRSCLVAVILLFLLINGVVVYLDHRPLMVDSGIYYLVSLHIAKLVEHPTLHNLFQAWFRAGHDRPPLYFWSALPLYAVFGLHPDVAVSANLFWLALLLVATYKVGQHIHGKNAGLLGALLLGSYPLVFGISRVFMPEIALMAMVVLSYYFLLRSEAFTRRKESMLFGLCCGLGLLVKWTFLFFIIFTPLLVLYQCGGLSISRAKRQSVTRSRFCNLLLAGLLILALALPWYVVTAPLLRDFIVLYAEPQVITTFPQLLGVTEVLSLRSFLYYFAVLAVKQLYLPFVALFLVMLPFYARAKQGKKRYLAVWFLGPLFLLSFVLNRDWRASMPVLPAVALMTAIGICELQSLMENSAFFTKRKLSLRPLVLSFLVLLCTGYVAIVSFDIGTRQQAESHSVDYPLLSRPALNEPEVLFYAQPEWDETMVLSRILIEEDKRDSGGNSRILFLPDGCELGPHFASFAMRNNLPIEIEAFCVGGLGLLEPSKWDYVIIRIPAGRVFPEPQIAQAETAFRKMGDEFCLLNTYKSPAGVMNSFDGVRFFLYKRGDCT